MRKVVTVIGILILLLLLGILILSLISQIPLLAAVNNVISGIVGIVSDLGNTIGRALSGFIPEPGGN